MIAFFRELQVLESKSTASAEYQTTLSNSVALLRSQKMQLLNGNNALREEIVMLRFFSFLFNFHRKIIKQSDDVRKDIGSEIAEFLFDLTQISNKYTLPEQVVIHLFISIVSGTCCHSF
jgi:hypothetical protein